MSLERLRTHTGTAPRPGGRAWLPSTADCLLAGGERERREGEREGGGGEGERERERGGGGRERGGEGEIKRE